MISAGLMRFFSQLAKNNQRKETSVPSSIFRYQVALVTAVLWALGSLVIGLILVFGPFSDFSRTQRIAVMEVTVTFAGFGAALLTLIFATIPLILTLRQPKLEIRPQVRGKPTVRADDKILAVDVYVKNVGPVIARVWTVDLAFTVGKAVGQTLSAAWNPPSGPVWTYRPSVDIPLFSNADILIGSFELTVDGDVTAIPIGYKCATEASADLGWQNALLIL